METDFHPTRDELVQYIRKLPFEQDDPIWDHLGVTLAADVAQRLKEMSDSTMLNLICGPSEEPMKKVTRRIKSKSVTGGNEESVPKGGDPFVPDGVTMMQIGEYLQRGGENGRSLADIELMLGGLDMVLLKATVEYMLGKCVVKKIGKGRGTRYASAEVVKDKQGELPAVS